MFKPDRWGSNFFFIDLDYYSDGMAGAYWEISREISLANHNTWALHLEYDGGEATKQAVKSYAESSSRFQHAFLAGGAYNWASSDFLRTFSAQVLWKYYFKGQYRGAYNSVQFTGVWGVSFGCGLFTFSGYADLWYDPDVQGKWSFAAEPQIWFNVDALRGCKDVHLSLGSEVEVSNNFVYNDDGANNRFYAIPTVAAKWTF